MTTPSTPEELLELARQADDWFAGGWRDDEPETITLGKIMCMTAQGLRNENTLDPELSNILNANMRKQNEALGKVRAEQRRMNAKRHPVRIY